MVSLQQFKTWHGRVHKSGKKQQKLRCYSLSINLNKCWIMILIAHTVHARSGLVWREDKSNKVWQNSSEQTEKKQKGTICMYHMDDLDIACFFMEILFIHWKCTMVKIMQGSLKSTMKLRQIGCIQYFHKKTMTELTDVIKMHHKAAEKYHISSKKLNDSEKRKVKDHCCYIGLYQRAAYNALHIHFLILADQHIIFKTNVNKILLFSVK